MGWPLGVSFFYTNDHLNPIYWRFLLDFLSGWFLSLQSGLIKLKYIGKIEDVIHEWLSRMERELISFWTLALW